MTVVPVKEGKDMRYQDSIVKDCITAMAEDRIPEVTVSYLDCTQSSYASHFQFPIDNQLIKELADKRKATFSKVKPNLLT